MYISGRLVLADGVAYVTKHLNPDIVIDMATLTGAQGIELISILLDLNDNNHRIRNRKGARWCLIKQ